MPCPYCGRDKCPGDGVYLFESEVIEALRSCRNAMLQGAASRVLGLKREHADWCQSSGPDCTCQASTHNDAVTLAAEQVLHAG